MDLGGVLAQSLRVTVRDRRLWLFGFLAALGRGTNPSFRDGFSPDLDTRADPRPFFEILRWILDHLPLLAAGFLAFLFLALLIALLAVWGQGALILGAGEALADRPPPLGSIARQATRRYPRVLGILLLLGAPGVLMSLFFLFLTIIVVGLIFLFEGREEISRALGVPILCLGGSVLLGCLLPLTWAFHLWSRLALRAALLEDRPWREALGQGLRIARRRIGEVLLLWLIADVAILGLLTSVLVFAVSGLFLLFDISTLVPLFREAGQVDLSTLLRGLGVALLFGICLDGLSRLLLAPVLTFVETAWTAAYTTWARPPAAPAGAGGSG